MTVLDDTATLYDTSRVSAAITRPCYVVLDFTACGHRISRRVLPYIDSAQLGDQAPCPVCIRDGRTVRKATGPVRETRGSGHASRDLRCPVLSPSKPRIPCNAPIYERAHAGWCRFYESAYDVAQDWTLIYSGKLPGMH